VTAPHLLVTGGGGFIGSHMVRRLLADGAARVVVYDNWSSGRRWHLEPLRQDRRLEVVDGDLQDLRALTAAMRGVETVVHLASNPDIAKAMTQPDVDFWQGTYLTHNVVEAMRVGGAREILYASGSGVYGDAGETPVAEDWPRMEPISTYGASKLAGEALIAAYCHMFDLTGRAFRFANVVGPNQTHGVAYDFIRRLTAEPHRLTILGDGRQSKSYVHVDDVVGAILFPSARAGRRFDCFNVATEDYLTVREIADLVVDRMGLRDVAYEFTGGDRGWKGDVPVVRFDTRKLRALGWTNRCTAREAMRDAVDGMLAGVREGKLA
jgi:UDP-glucose 4-epimerase